MTGGLTLDLGPASVAVPVTISGNVADNTAIQNTPAPAPTPAPAEVPDVTGGAEIADETGYTGPPVLTAVPARHPAPRG